jgi:methylated-DNA-protein-cysteine methyltransferase-like protein
MKQTFTDKVYAVVARIPRGKVASYGLVAMLAGQPRAARAVGMAMRDVPGNLRLPCHRVIRSDGTLACKRIFSGRQRGMLEREGVTFRENGRVDMARCEWNPPPRSRAKTS